MLYSDFIAIINDLHRGGSMPDSINNIAKLVLNKMARTKLPDSKRTVEITTGGANEFLLSTFIPDFVALKTDLGNNNKGAYYFESTNPIFLNHCIGSQFAQGLEGGYTYIDGGKLKVSWPFGNGAPATLYVPIYSKFLVIDADTGEAKEAPEKDGDTFVFNSVFDDVFIEGILVYLDRKDMDDTEYMKALSAWNKALNDLVFYS